MPEFEECIAPPTSPSEIDYDDSDLLALRIEKTREKLSQKYPTCNLPQITTKLVHQYENVPIENDNIVNNCEAHSYDCYNQSARHEQEPAHRKVLSNVQPYWSGYLPEKWIMNYSTTPFPPRGLLHSRHRSTRLLPLEVKHSNLQMKVPHKGGHNPIILNNGHKRGTDTKKLVHQREALPNIIQKNRNTQRKGTKKDGSQSILYEIKTNYLSFPSVPINYRSNVCKRQKSIYTKLCENKRNFYKNQIRSTLLPKLPN